MSHTVEQMRALTGLRRDHERYPECAWWNLQLPPDGPIGNDHEVASFRESPMRLYDYPPVEVEGQCTRRELRRARRGHPDEFVEKDNVPYRWKVKRVAMMLSGHVLVLGTGMGVTQQCLLLGNPAITAITTVDQDEERLAITGYAWADPRHRSIHAPSIHDWAMANAEPYGGVFLFQPRAGTLDRAHRIYERCLAFAPVCAMRRGDQQFAAEAEHPADPSFYPARGA